MGGAPDEIEPMIEKHGKAYDAPRAHCDKAREEPSLQTPAIEDTLLEAGETMIELGLVDPALKS